MIETGVTTPFTYEILVDHRENPKVREKLRALEGAVVTELQLPVGDVIIPHAGVAIERKSVGDFIASLYDAGKVYRQLEELRLNYKRPVLVLHGDVNEHLSWVRTDANRTHRTFLSALVGVAMMGIPIVPANSDDEYLEVIKAFARQSDPNRKEAERPIQTRKSADRTLAEEQEDVICAIRGIGRKASRKLLEELETPVGVLLADRERLQEIDGVGKKTADHLAEVGNTKYGSEIQES